MERKPRVSVVGATGLVGREIVRILEARRFPLSELTLFASSRSAGETCDFLGDPIRVQELKREDFLANTDIALCSAGRKVSEVMRNWSAEAEVIVVDNSSAFRMDADVPLVVPEINPEALNCHSGYVANPNCSTIQLVMALHPIREAFGLRRVAVATYQSVSGAGNKGIEELSAQSISLFNQVTMPEPEVFPTRIAFNVIPQIGSLLENGFSEEEMKVVHETRKILDAPHLPVTCTAVRVPVFAVHCEAVLLETEKDVQPSEIREVLSDFPGVLVTDGEDPCLYPTPVGCVERDEVFVGRIRRDPFGPCWYSLWVVSDNLWKGAALNAVQIAEHLRLCDLL